MFPNDGSRLYLNNRLLIDNGGMHGMKEVKTEVALQKGLHPIKVLHFETEGSDDLKVTLQGPGLEKQEIPAVILFQNQ